MSFTDFRIGFWHPFGPHGKETPQEIIERKRGEIDKNGWTLWSFQYRRMLTDWHDEIVAANPNSVFVFCSEGRGAVDPASDGTLNNVKKCQSYRFVTDGEAEWRAIPKERVEVPHPFRPGKTLASAFIVKRVIFPVESFAQTVEWYSVKKGPWCQGRVPTRGEYLIRPGGMYEMRRFRAVLELMPPYLAVVNADGA